MYHVKDQKKQSPVNRKLLKEGQPPAAALRSAQLEMRKSGKWGSPFYWAPFILQGEFH